MLTVPKRCHTGLGRRALLPSLFVLLIAACKGAEPVRPYEPITSPEKLFMSATLNHHAINLSTKAPFDTTHLSMVVSDARGQPLDGLPAPTFLSRDTAAVQITPDGVLHARKAGQGILVIGEVTAEGNVRHADTAIVNVTANPNPPVLTSFSIHPVPPDSAVLAYQSTGATSPASRWLLTTAGVTKGVAFLWSPPPPSARAQDAGGVPITNLVIDYRSLDATVAYYYNSQTLILSQPGQVALVASTTAYGVTKADTAVFTVSLPIAQGVQIVQAADGVASFKPSEIRLRPGGYVFWFNGTANGVDVSFDDPTHAVEITPLCQKFGAAFCGTGDIPASLDPLPSGTAGLGLTVRGRQLIAPGVYTYHSSAISASGRIIVTDSATTR